MVFSIDEDLYSAKAPCSAVKVKSCFGYRKRTAFRPTTTISPPSPVAKAWMNAVSPTEHITTFKHRIASKTAAVQHSVRYLIR